MTWNLEPAGAADFGPCDCCGGQSRTVWGFLHRDGETLAAYYVQWTLGQVQQHGAHFDLVVGRWGDGATAGDRSLACLEFRRTDNGPAFRVIDAETRSAARSGLADTVLSRAEVLEGSLREQLFAMVDEIYLHDARIAELSHATA